MKRQRFLFGWLIAVLLALAACGPATSEPSVTAGLQITYTVGECNQDIPMDQLAVWAKVDITAKDGAVQIRQNLAYVCCAEIEIKVEQEGNVVKVIETNEGDLCECMCGYEVNAEIAGLPPGRYTIQVWGVEYEDVHSLELLGEEEIEL